MVEHLSIVENSPTGNFPIRMLAKIKLGGVPLPHRYLLRLIVRLIITMFRSLFGLILERKFGLSAQRKPVHAGVHRDNLGYGIGDGGGRDCVHVCGNGLKSLGLIGNLRGETKKDHLLPKVSFQFFRTA